MRKQRFLLIAVCVGLSFVIGAFGGEHVYTFERQDAWDAITGKWQVINGEFVKNDSETTKAGIAVLKKSEGIDMKDVESIEVTLMDLGTGPFKNATIVFGFDEAKPISFQVGVYTGGAQAWQIQTFNSATKGDISVVSKKPESLQSSKWYHLKVVFVQNMVIVYGGEQNTNLLEKIRYTFSQGKPSGRIGLGGVGNNAKYFNFKVTGSKIVKSASRKAM